MFEKVLSKNAKESLALLGNIEFFRKAHLAGGTAITLQLGHRVSKDFDFFTKEKFNARNLANKLKEQLPNFKLEKVAWGTIMGYIGKIRFTLFYYNYPLLFKPKSFLGINIADLRDIAAMKIASISDRGWKRDFIDLYFLLKNRIVSLEECLNLYDQKFKVLQQNKAHILKSLIYFEDAEKEKMPKMFQPVTWLEIKGFLEREVKNLGKKIIK